MLSVPVFPLRLEAIRHDLIASDRMLTFYGSNTRGPIAVPLDVEALPEATSWIDAFDPSEEESDRLARWLGARIPRFADLIEIESSSRLALEGEALVMSLPAMMKDTSGYPTSTPIGFVVTPRTVVTIRFAHLPSFENLAELICRKGDLSAGGPGATTSVLEILVDHIADLLERIGGELDGMSRSIFTNGILHSKSRRPHRTNLALMALLREVGRCGDAISKISETLLGLSRMTPFLATKAKVGADLKERIDTISTDVRSLHEYQEHLANKTQFLLDTLLGLSNIEQNNVFRVLTVVSVIGIPPTFIASMYGMNFKNMPELEWSHGYAYGLTLIAVSAIAPAIWFKVKGWW